MSKRKRHRSSRPLKVTKSGTFLAGRKSRTGKRVELYTAAYKLAVGQIPSVHWREQPNISLQIHASIRRQLKEGETDARRIAFAAVQDVLVPETP